VDVDDSWMWMTHPPPSWVIHLKQIHTHETPPTLLLRLLTAQGGNVWHLVCVCVYRTAQRCAAAVCL
jgi:hypothetical protein